MLQNGKKITTGFFITGLLIPTLTYAVCPICTFAVGAGIGLTQYLGIDDSITGLWVGAFIVSLIIWTKNWFANKKICFYGCPIIVTVFYYAATIVPLYLMGVMGHDLNKMWGIDKILLGIILGSIVFYLFSACYEILKKNNNGRAYFPFQKVVMPIVPLIVLTWILHRLSL